MIVKTYDFTIRLRKLLRQETYLFFSFRTCKRVVKYYKTTLVTLRKT